MCFFFFSFLLLACCIFLCFSTVAFRRGKMEEDWDGLKFFENPVNSKTPTHTFEKNNYYIIVSKSFEAKCLHLIMKCNNLIKRLFFKYQVANHRVRRFSTPASRGLWDTTTGTAPYTPHPRGRHTSSDPMPPGGREGLRENTPSRVCTSGNRSKPWRACKIQACEYYTPSMAKTSLLIAPTKTKMTSLCRMKA